MVVQMYLQPSHDLKWRQTAANLLCFVVHASGYVTSMAGWHWWLKITLEKPGKKGRKYNAVQVGDEGLRSLRALHNLRRLGLAGTDVTSESGELLASFTKLESLDLQWCSIDDAGRRGLGWLMPRKS